MTAEQAQELIRNCDSSLRFDYVLGRPVKVNLTGDEFDPARFDRDNGGPGAAQKIIDRLRTTKDVNPPESQESHANLTHTKAHDAMDLANSPNRRHGNVFSMGGADLGSDLQKAVDHQLNRLKDSQDEPATDDSEGDADKRP
ncbi:hypothetical protein [Nocardia brasiliensis]|uniref:hypothetical protein n=1 Tax=Nocardia brasiliensis TaxID=37326 RepID=UPI002458E375|nr:hypothetical protein [Nocardia brasiliensis]